MGSNGRKLAEARAISADVVAIKGLNQLADQPKEPHDY
jgi:hypothetical protein